MPLLLGALVLIDWRHSGFSGVRLVWWAALGVQFTIILLPPRVAAVDNSHVARGLFIRRRMCTARLVAVRMVDGVTQRLVLSDASGGRLELNPRVQVANPLLWHHLEQGARHSLEQGTLLYGMPVVESMARRIDGEACRGILRASDLK
ncbi:hypothetical protein [Streptomyces sp. NPDC088794]|uniref:hypothetical protein n=1 Tax=Streptomyces sp. NPDC088794 TaxID=3365902 RepID=UPI00382EA128